MRILICGDRKWNNREAIRKVIADLPPDSIVITGGAPGADTIAAEEAMRANLIVEIFHADWQKYGRAAGPIRNSQMLRKGAPDKVIAFHENLWRSKGTANMVNQAMSAGVPCTVVTGR